MNETTTPPEMQPFVPFVGRTWSGRGADGAVADVARWEFILGGRAVQVTHRLVGDTYGGRSIIFFDPASASYVVAYFTTGGFYSLGTIRLTVDGFESDEEIKGGTGVSRVRGRVTLADGQMVSRSSYLRDGQWVNGHAFTYRETPDREVGY